MDFTQFVPIQHATQTVMKKLEGSERYSEILKELITDHLACVTHQGTLDIEGFRDLDVDGFELAMVEYAATNHESPFESFLTAVTDELCLAETAHAGGMDFVGFILSPPEESGWLDISRAFTNRLYETLKDLVTSSDPARVLKTVSVVDELHETLSDGTSDTAQVELAGMMLATIDFLLEAHDHWLQANRS